MIYRPRKLRRTQTIRDMVGETSLNQSDLIYPIFVREGTGILEPIASMPGVFRFSADMLDDEIADAVGSGVTAVMVFGIPEAKDAVGSGAYDPNGVAQTAIRRIHELAPDMIVIADICMCEYTDHGHCGILDADGTVNNDETVRYLSQIAVSCAEAGADMVAPSDMMDGRVAAIRSALDAGGYSHVPIMAYSAKYASNFYGPFRDAACSAPSFGDRRSYQMDYRNSDEAMRELAADIEEGADILMVKPALMCLDIIRRAKSEFHPPLAAYIVSGEYAMLANAIGAGLLNPDAMYEAHIAVKRAGAGMIITYAAKEMARRCK